MPPQQPYPPYPPQQPGGQQPPGGPHSGGYQYPSGGYPQPTGGQYYASPPPAPKRRRIWPWVLLAIVLIPMLTVVSCSALFAGGVAAVQDQRAGGTLPIGQTFTYKDGTALTVTDLGPYRATNPYSVTKAETAYQGTVTVVNGSKSPENTVTVTINISVGGVAAERVFDNTPFADQDLAPGQTAKIPFQFKVKKGTAGPMQVSVSAGFNEPVFFTGSLK